MAYRYRVPKKFDLTKQQIKNLTKLADKLETVPNNQFDMNSFFSTDSGWHTLDPEDVTPKHYAPECGTVACACGWGPAAGVKVLIAENWNEYAARAFGANYVGQPGRHLWNYLFDEDQGGTALMAAKRIRTVLNRVS